MRLHKHFNLKIKITNTTQYSEITYLIHRINFHIIFRRHKLEESNLSQVEICMKISNLSADQVQSDLSYVINSKNFT